jgi:translation initiation factor IF-3
MSQVETDPKIAGRNITMTLAPLPANRRKRKFTAPGTDEESEEAAALTEP